MAQRKNKEERKRETTVLTALQDAFVHDDHPYSLLAGKRGSGKTHAACARVVRYALQYPGARLLVCAPTLTMVRHILCPALLNLCPSEDIVDRGEGTRRMVLGSGSIVQLCAADAIDRLRGQTFAVICLDEAGSVRKDTFDLLRMRWRHRYYPMQCWLTAHVPLAPWIEDEWSRRGTQTHARYDSDDRLSPPSPVPVAGRNECP